MSIVTAPFTEMQVAALNRWQTLGYVHEFTCPSDDHDRDSRVLTAGPDGWVCSTCGYRQNWAHDFMADPAQHPRPPTFFSH